MGEKVGKKVGKKAGGELKMERPRLEDIGSLVTNDGGEAHIFIIDPDV